MINALLCTKKKHVLMSEKLVYILISKLLLSPYTVPQK